LTPNHLTHKGPQARDQSGATVKNSNRFRRLNEGGLLERSRAFGFDFDGLAMSGFAGDTLASALLANGQVLFGRSFKYHRPRGLFTAGSEEPNALVELRTHERQEPNTKATTVELYDGLVAKSQNRWPSLAFDVQSINSLFAPFFAAGFYYKTFMWPSAFWEKVYEPLIRRSAGLGRAASAEDPDRYEQAYAFCDVLVVGSGPSGLAAAFAAARSGARVILCDEDFRLGGRLLTEVGTINDVPFSNWVETVTAELASLPNVRMMARTAVFGAYDGQTYGAVERVADNVAVPGSHHPRLRLWRIITKRSVLASGAIERAIVFGGNDRPGVMLASALRSYANRFALVPEGAVAIFTNNNDGWRTATDLAAKGATVRAVIDVRRDVSKRLQALACDAQIILGGEVVATRGWHGIKTIEVHSERGRETIDVNTLGVSGGWTPNLALSCHTGGQPKWQDSLAAFVPGNVSKGMTAVGMAKGTAATVDCLAEGYAAGRQAAEDLGLKATPQQAFAALDEDYAITPYFDVTRSRQKAFVDLQNDVTAFDIELAVQEGFRSSEHLKRYTTLGMATDQGKTSNVNGLAIMAALTRQQIPDAEITTFRPPYVPVAIGAFAGAHRSKDFRPSRLTPSHDWAAEMGAVFVETGPWLRAQYFPRPDENDWLTTVNREVQTVRNAVGFCDVSTLGKIEIHGPDAAAFLDRLYINTFSTLAVGRARYGVMLREDGFVMDDGTTSRLADDRFFMTTTTANAGRVFQHMKFCHQVLWPDLDVQFVSGTDEWAQFSVAGPRCRNTLAKIVDDDISNENLPYMGVMEVSVGGAVTGRLYRLSFSGELAYELGVPARYGDALARALMEAGADFGIAPYGTEALGAMRIEKGHVAGNEIDGRTTATDLGFAKMMSKKKDFIGCTLAQRPALMDQKRLRFVGFKPISNRDRLRAGSHLIPDGEADLAENDQGAVTSVAFSPSLGHWVGLGLLERGPERMGEQLWATDPLRGNRIRVEVCNPCFVDPEGVRLRG
jgi:sarcosine oxidase subunit alpha